MALALHRIRGTIAYSRRSGMRGLIPIQQSRISLPLIRATLGLVISPSLADVFPAAARINKTTNAAT